MYSAFLGLLAFFLIAVAPKKSAAEQYACFVALLLRSNAFELGPDPSVE
jgi:hypothetical protein